MFVILSAAKNPAGAERRFTAVNIRSDRFSATSFAMTSLPIELALLT
jgi:hypothetical protein